DVGIVAVQNGPVLEALDIEDQAQLSELVADEQPTAIDPNEILIYDPTAAPKSTGRISLSTVAENNLIEKSRYGFLPKIGVNGEKSVRAYSRPAGIVSGRKNQIAIIIGGLGLNETTTQSVLTDLPAETTLAFAPYANGLFDWMAQARGRGHELLIQLPLEPFDYPNNDPGPKTLLVDDIWDANVDRLHWLLSRMTNYVGVVNYLGARYSASPEALRPLFNELRSRGLLYVDDGSTPLSRSSEVADELNVPFAQSSLVLDTLLTAEDIDAQLLELESLAREKGIAIGVASAFPITVKRLKRWAEGAERRGIKLIPISATLNKSSF
ncbi:MAG: divergent polysaccharide deacetylase family protein, partial [Hyphomicrobiales bacterium]